jgi:N-sulfoglucosamine sulfohydrolase
MNHRLFQPAVGLAMGAGALSLSSLFRAVLIVSLVAGMCVGSLAAGKPNVLIITVDDMSADSLGAFGCKLPGTSPQIDRLASQGMRFNRAHVVVGNCMPSRNVMWSGLYPHNNRIEGFYQVPDAKHPHLVNLMKGAGYFTGIRHKVAHSTPYSPYGWDIDLDTDPAGKRADVKNAKSYRASMEQALAGARKAGKPFCLVMNVADPHKPFYAEDNRGQTIPDNNVPTQVFKPGEMPIPGFLFDDPVVRKELSHYYSSVRRADDCVGEILAALDASGQRDNTLIVFLSDHGMPLPFAKTQLYHHSTRTPLCFIVPGVTKPGTVDNNHMISAVDVLPTLLDLTGVQHPGRLDGRSFAPLLRGGTQDARDYVFKEHNENAGGSRDPMRAIQSRQYLYLFNPWSNGKRVMATATTGTSTYRRMAELAKTEFTLEARHKLYQHRVPEELYDVEKDPDCLNNLIQLSSHQVELNKLRTTLESWMVKTGDGMLTVFRKRDDAAAREAYVAAQEKEADDRRAGGEGKVRGKKKAAAKAAGVKPAPVKGASLIAFALPETISAGKPVTVKIDHNLPADLGEPVLTVTFKGGPDGQRLDRKTVKARGKGVAEVTFSVPTSVPGNTVSFAAFVGEDFQTTPQRVQTAQIALH